MSERLPQSVVDERFKELVSGDSIRAVEPVRELRNIPDDALATLHEHYEHLKKQGYSEEEIQEFFDIYITEEGAYEV